ncbi:glycosyltransferase [Flavobacteriaceae bacterium GSB9]|nr:glycosyltransferase [Flavobacteriaceae bacterium GSB9]
MKKLTIISHTEHYKTTEGQLVGFGATVTEINGLLEVFDKIVHVAVLYDQAPPLSALPYRSKAIRLVALPRVGGKSISDKLKVMWNAPKILSIIHNSLKGSTHFQFRAPTGMGVYVIPYLVFFSSKKGWFKYAGNWKQKHAPLAYQFQRWVLKQQHRKVTINGNWPNQPKHCLSFENPCLTNEELATGKITRNTKDVSTGKRTLCFVGRMEAAKGIELLIESLLSLNPLDKDLIDTIHFIGQGEGIDNYKQRLAESGMSFTFHGTLPRNSVHHIYKSSHFLILPSQSEGFPKVVSEALNYGCVPVVSNVSAIGQYITHGKQGVLLNRLTTRNLTQRLQFCLQMDANQFKACIHQPEPFYEQFTYAHYNNRIFNEVLKADI